ncbi:putative 3-hydroxyisobutyrate dehydrogenase [Pseudooceanicola batsensis HTCC2597]|uniref:Putative 3-hydroxyisobutyrate dehydrogenase n=1 Tax=Pseudooceanicola batsensis (strain ATCC BAA-863 / DSM 15984 / KCTC 12145 / HTCC2597) TaxID=252305 RepID=A3U0J5_PSEBH|nr:NAD(P)-dependent oxidoreductase [Pseudooceanicola batsensis]EAQ02286.1 putative 3-hydroxyisobutyrate dehydrogenase [Pseudooceanicola batsensis HTCC2597]
MHVGIIGVGLMGHGIARNVLSRGGFGLSFLDHPGNQPTDEIRDLGGTPCATPAEVAAVSDVVILCVTGSPQVEAIVAGEGGLATALRAGAVVVDCSTSLPETTLRMADAVRAAGGDYIDAPMTRTAKHAHEGTLNLLAGGAAEVLDRVRPVLASFTERVDHVGALGHGHRLKLLHNYVSVGFMTLLAEAAAQAADADVDPQVFVDVLAGGGGASAALDRLAPYITQGDREGLPFFVSNAQKDIGYYRVMSEAAGARTTIADGVHAALAQPVEAGRGDAYVPELVSLFRRDPEG